MKKLNKVQIRQIEMLTGFILYSQFGEIITFIDRSPVKLHGKQNNVYLTIRTGNILGESIMFHFDGHHDLRDEFAIPTKWLKSLGEILGGGDNVK